jgi:tetratricopeptide (TPR) repeat protein
MNKPTEQRMPKRLNHAPALLSVTIAALLLFTNTIKAQNDTTVYTQAIGFYGQNRFDSAAVYFAQLIDSFPERKEGYFDRGLCFYKLGNDTLAISDLDNALKLDSAFSDARLLKILVLQHKGDYKSAYTEFSMLDTTYAGYIALKKRIQHYRLAVLISNNWYYMIAIMFMVIILFAVASKTMSYRKG